MPSLLEPEPQLGRQKRSSRWTGRYGNRKLEPAPRLRRQKLAKASPLKALKQYPLPYAGEAEYKSSPSLVQALKAMSDSNAICLKILAHKNTNEDSLFASLVHICQDCRSGFGVWSEGEILDGPSIHRERLKFLMDQALKAMSQGVVLLDNSPYKKLVVSYKNHIQNRINLLDIAEKEGFEAYELALSKFLQNAHRSYKRWIDSQRDARG